MTEMGPDTVEVGHDSRIRPRSVLAAVVVAAVMGGGAVAVRQAATDHEAAPTRAPTPVTPSIHRAGEIVPWRDLPPGHPVFRRDRNGVRDTPYDDVSATGTIAGTLREGDRLVFDALLVSPGLVSLRPCPDYTITFGGQHVTRQLNCAEVPYYASLVRPDGRVTSFRPVLPAGTAVAFRMTVVVPDAPGDQEVRWTLEGPAPTPGFSGTVHVG